MPKNILVVGMARSGTSLSASVFAKNGYFVAEDEERELKPGNVYNPIGFFEAESLIARNRQIFNYVGYQFDNTWMYAPIQDKHVALINQLSPSAEHISFVQKYNGRSPWVWKDPRLCYTLRYWWPLMDSNTAVLLVTRKKEAIYNSFLRTKWIGASKAERDATYACIEAHITNAKQALLDLNIPHVEVDYDDYRVAPRQVCNKLNAAFGLTLTESQLNYHPEYNHSSLMGRLSTRLDMLLNRLPTRWINTLKRATPRGVRRAFFPERG